MKPLFLIPLSFLLFSFVGNKHKNDLELKNLKGKVKTTIELWYPVNTKTGKMDTIPEKTIENYDSEGNMLSSNSYQQNGKILFSSTYQFNKPKRLIINKILNEKSRQLNIIQFDTNLNWISIYGFDEYNSLTDIMTFKYDSNGNNLGHYIYNPTLVSYSIDASGTRKDRFPLNKDSVIDIREIDGTWQVSKFIYKYDSMGNQIEEETYLNDTNKLSSRSVFKYDNKDDKIEVSRYDEANGKLYIRYNCKYLNYDKQGNWTKQIRLHNNVVEGITKRTIEYYP